MKKLAIVLVLLIFTITGCSSPSESAKTEPAIKVVDDTSSTIVLDKPAQRVISLAPSNTEIVFAIGKQDSLVGVSNFCNYPEEARQIQKVGDYFNPNTEMILDLNPELVLAVKGVQESLIATLKKNNIPVYVYDPHSVEGIVKNILDTGKMLGAEEEAEKVAEELRQTIKQQEPTGLKIFVEINPEPIITAGSNTFISDLIKKSGCQNVGDEFGEGYPVVSPEALLDMQPDIYLISKNIGVTPDDVAARPGFNSLDCVKEGNVFVISDDDVFFRPGPRIIKAYEELLSIIERVKK